MLLRAEFTTEPFHGEGDPPPHATETLALLENSGLTCEFGPLGTMVEGPEAVLLPALQQVLDIALHHGASRVTLQVERVDE
ncbi:thiamine-binding protein [Nocardia sp. 2]|uniref:Thiamine-binding protein n=1 Tax=Nocardia acididurans TaxID=2802282 RepID=A0ABS1M8C1_9NOCA|nr:thiamine-binding protein [Nocardia acididurans]MBL1076474.1 thiamine-binding protein [Nocardia acididurans]